MNNKTRDNSVATYPFNVGRMTEIMRVCLGPSAMVMQESSVSMYGRDYVSGNAITTPSHLLVFSDEDGPKSIAMFSLGHQLYQSTIGITWDEIQNVERWFALQKEGSPHIKETGIWYLLPPDGTSSTVCNIITHARMKEIWHDALVHEQADRNSHLVLESDLSTGFEFLAKENISRSGWFNHRFVEIPPPRNFNPEDFCFPELAVVGTQTLEDNGFRF